MKKTLSKRLKVEEGLLDAYFAAVQRGFPMIVGQKMLTNVITIHKDETVVTAFERMRKHRIRHLPVVAENRLVGILSDRDIKLALIPDESTGGRERGYYLVETTTVAEIMTSNPITVTPQTPIEEAAKLIQRYKIGGLPVIENDELVGIITETDLLEVFIEFMGLIKESCRLDIVLGDKTNAFEEVSQIIQQAGGNILSVGLTPHNDPAKRIYHFRLELVELEPIITNLVRAGYKVIDSYTS
jgi:acetoin utilization protein AcuB